MPPSPADDLFVDLLPAAVLPPAGLAADALLAALLAPFALVLEPEAFFEADFAADAPQPPPPPLAPPSGSSVSLLRVDRLVGLGISTSFPARLELGPPPPPPRREEPDAAPRCPEDEDGCATVVGAIVAVAATAAVALELPRRALDVGAALAGSGAADAPAVPRAVLS